MLAYASMTPNFESPVYQHYRGPPFAAHSRSRSAVATSLGKNVSMRISWAVTSPRGHVGQETGHPLRRQVLPQQGPAPVDHDGRIGLLLRQQMAERPRHDRQFRPRRRRRRYLARRDDLAKTVGRRGPADGRDITGAKI